MPAKLGAYNVALTLRGDRYLISSGGGATGKLEAKGRLLEFGANNLCPGTGLYQWQLDGERLELTPATPDECPGRADALVDVIYTLLTR